MHLVVLTTNRYIAIHQLANKPTIAPDAFIPVRGFSRQVRHRLKDGDSHFGLILASANKAGTVDIAAVGPPLHFATAPNEVAAPPKARNLRGIGK